MLNNKLIVQFLLRETIPPKSKEKDRIYDAVFKAHRDVLSGRFYLPNYCNSKNGSNENSLVIVLYKYITEKKLCNNNMPAKSSDLICYLCKKFPNVEFGAIQKLVNMTLKYLVCLYEFDKPIFRGYKIDSIGYDCPIDSNILNKLGTKHTVWTKMDKKEYLCVQKEIHNKLIENGHDGGNLLFDLINWN
ncbi:MAG: hypothetical protein KBS62_03825 [Oscillospiraceae bacterium]|nr:hypothetical protein [Candidatus Ruminococcus equi]